MSMLSLPLIHGQRPGSLDRSLALLALDPTSSKLALGKLDETVFKCNRHPPLTMLKHHLRQQTTPTFLTNGDPAPQILPCHLLHLPPPPRHRAMPAHHLPRLKFQLQHRVMSTPQLHLHWHCPVQPLNNQHHPAFTALPPLMLFLSHPVNRLLKSLPVAVELYENLLATLTDD